MSTPVDGYIRVSRVGGRAGDSFISPELQRKSIERVAEKEGLTVVKWFEELDASGGDNTRPKWNEAIQRVESGKTRGIACWNLSRFSRSLPDALAALERIESAGGKVYSEEGNLGKLSRNILLAVAEDERERHKAGFRNATANAIHRGIYISARIPFGYIRDLKTRKLNPDPDTAPILVELFERRAKGQSWRQLGRWMLEEHGLQKAPQTLRGMISNEAYLGVARQGDIRNEKAHQALVTRKLWNEANKAKGRKPIHTGVSKNLLLRGIITCGNCGHKMVVGSTRGKVAEKGTDGWKSAKREKVPTYQCRNHACDAHAYATGSEADAIAVRFVMFLLSNLYSMQTNETHDPQELVQAERELEEAQEALDRFLANRQAIVTLGEDKWNELAQEYVVARDSAQVTLGTLKDEEPASYELLPQLWEEWTTESRREFLSKVLSQCDVEPARGEKIPLEQRMKITLDATEK